MQASVSLSLLDVKEAEKRCQYAARTLRKYAKQGKIEAQKIGGSWVFPEEEIDRLSDERAVA